MESPDNLRGVDAGPNAAVYARMEELQSQMEELRLQLQSTVKLETEADRQTIKSALQNIEGGEIFKEAVANQYSQARMQQQQTAKEVLQLKRQVQENSESWETAQLEYVPFNFNGVPEIERKYIRLLAKDLGQVDWSTKSVKDWVTHLTRLFNESFVVSRMGRLAVIFNACSKSTQERLLAADFGTDSADAEYDFVALIKTLGAVYNIVNHAIVAQNELGRGLKQERVESIICFIERVQETFHQAYGPPSGWSAFHRTKLVEAMVNGVTN